MPPERDSVAAGLAALATREAARLVASARARRPGAAAQWIDPWDGVTGPDRAPAVAQNVEIEADGETMTLTLELSPRGFLVRTGDAILETRHLGLDDEAPEGAMGLARVVIDGDQALVLRDARQTRVAFANPLARDAETDAAGGALLVAPMHGRVAKIMVAAGESVAAGATLAIVEAMKMEHPLVAPRAGKIAEILAREGAQVSQGAGIVRLEEEDT
jgi:3-methylcrotonyl-CoA carboxylase alpha subunit